MAFIYLLQMASSGVNEVPVSAKAQAACLHVTSMCPFCSLFPLTCVTDLSADFLEVTTTHLERGGRPPIAGTDMSVGLVRIKVLDAIAGLPGPLFRVLAAALSPSPPHLVPHDLAPCPCSWLSLLLIPASRLVGRPPR